MKETTLPQLQQLKADEIKDFYYLELELNGIKIEADINFENKQIDNDLLDHVISFIKNIEKYDKLNRKYISDDFEKEGEVVKTYIERHLQLLDDDVLDDIIDVMNEKISHEIQFLNKIHLIGFSIYPHDNDIFAIFDYTIGEEFTDYLIVINTNRHGNLDHLTMEN